MAALPPVVDPMEASLNICGFVTQAAREAITVTQGLNSLDLIAQLEVDSVTAIQKDLAGRTNATGKFHMNILQTTNFRALIWWLKDLQDRGQPIGMPFTLPDLIRAKGQLSAYQKIKDASLDISKPESYPGNPSKWKAWWQSVTNYLANAFGVRRRPLLYVVRPTFPPPNASPEELEMHQVTLQGPEYDQDNKLVYGLLKSITLSTTAHPWVQPFERTSDGRKAALRLLQMNAGAADDLTRYQNAKAALSHVHYKNEQSFPFSKFVSKLEGIYQDMFDAGRPRPEMDKVDDLRTKMQVEGDPPLLFIKMTYTAKFPDDFHKCVVEMSRDIAQLYGTTDSNKRHRQISQTDTDRNIRGRGNPRGGRGWGRGRGRGGGRSVTSDSASSFNGVDVSDVARNFTAQEMSQLGDTGRKYVYNQRRSLNGGRGRFSHRGRGRGRPYGGRTIAAISEESSQVSDMTPSVRFQEQTTDGSNGNAHGRNARGRGRGGRH